MRWIGISGSRTMDDRVVADIKYDIGEIMRRGDGLVAGGALGVDFHATQEALKGNPAADRIRVIIPSRLATYREYFDRQLRGPSRNNSTSPAKVISLFQQLNALKSKGALVELSHVRVGTDSFHARNRAIVECSDELRAYCVNHSSGTTYTIRQAEAAGLSVKTRHYAI